MSKGWLESSEIHWRTQHVQISLTRHDNIFNFSPSNSIIISSDENLQSTIQKFKFVDQNNEHYHWNVIMLFDLSNRKLFDSSIPLIIKTRQKLWSSIFSEVTVIILFQEILNDSGKKLAIHFSSYLYESWLQTYSLYYYIIKIWISVNLEML